MPGVSDVAGVPPEGLLHFGLTAFVTLLVVVDPFGVAPIFVALAEGMRPAERRRTVRRAIAVASGVAAFFLVAGPALLAYLGVTVHAFGISGGILLFATAVPMLFGQRPRLQAPERDERATHGEDPAIFPLAIPLLSGPGTITTVLLLTARAAGDPRRLAVVAGAVAAVFVLAHVVLVLGDRIITTLGAGKVHMMTRVLGIVLAAVAVQYVLDGVAGYYGSLPHGGVAAAALRVSGVARAVAAPS
jgi:multiple antibiotic resistance protein